MVKLMRGLSAQGVLTHITKTFAKKINKQNGKKQNYTCGIANKATVIMTVFCERKF